MPRISQSIKTIFTSAARPRLPGDAAPPAATFALSSANNVDEGSTLTVTVNTANVRNLRRVYYEIVGDSLDVVGSGFLVISGNQAQFTVTPTADLLTEGAESFVVNLYKGARFGTLIATSTITINDTSAASLTVTPSSLSIDEGDTVTITVTVDSQDIPDGFVLYWSSSSASDTVIDSGSFVINSDAGSFTVSTTEDFRTEGEETLTIYIRSGSVTGPIIATSPEITVNDTSIETYAVTPAASSINEGDTLSLSVSTQGVPNGTTLYWAVSRPEDFSISSGSFVINNDSGSFSVIPTPDTISESSETFSVNILTGSISGTVVTTSSSITINNATYSVTPSANAVDEGSALSFTVATTNVNNGTTLYWTVSSTADFSVASGAFTVNANTGSFSVTARADELTEGTETFTVSIRRYSTSGPVVATSSSVTINDISIGIAPSNTELPFIGGSVRINSTLTTSNGTWTGAPAPTFTYQWQRGTTNISGATNSSYNIQVADGNNTLRCIVTATNATGSVSATTASTDTVPIPPSVVSDPTISGTLLVGQTITSSTGTWNGVPTPTFTYQWQRGIFRSNISGATNSSYVIQQADAGVLLRCRVTAINDGGAALAFTDSVTPGSSPVNTAIPVINGDAYVGETLTVSTGSWSAEPTPTYAYQWQRGSSNISGATSSNYTVTSSDFNNTLRCRVTATNTIGSGQVFSANTATVAVAPTGQSFTIPGTYTWIAPANVTRVSAVAVGGGGAGGAAYWAGGGGGGGGLGWKNNITVSPGSSYTVVVGAGGVGTTANDGGIGGDGTDSYFINSSTVRGEGGEGGQGTSTQTNAQYVGGAGGGYLGDGGSNGGEGGRSSNDTAGGGGGAAGYRGSGGVGGLTLLGGNWTVGNTGGGAGGAAGGNNSASGSAQSGGGVGIGGEGSSGTSSGAGGSGGTNGSPSGTSGGAANTGGFYGGGGGGQSNDSKNTPGCDGASGAVRIIWGGSPALTYPVGQGVIAASPPPVRAFNYVSDADQSFTVPSGVTSLTIKVWGAGGGSNRDAGAGGGGGFTSTTVSVTPGETLTVRVGRGGDGGGQGTSLTTSVQNASTRLIGGDGGWPGGGKGGNSSAFGAAGGGGGYSAVFRGGTLLALAGGGGGGGDDNGGGAGGGTQGQGASGGAGTQSAGGSSVFTPAIASGAFQGAAYGGGFEAGGGGGGGYYGGGAGGTWQGGGGGSGFVTGTGSTSAGSGRTPPGTGDSDYANDAGYGAAAGGTGESSTSDFIGLRGYPGRIVFRWEV